MKQKTFLPKVDTIERKWFIVDATDLTLGRMATEIATLLRGKHKPIYTPSLDVGDNVIVINADKVKVTGLKLEQKKYYRHSGYLGGIRETNLKTMLEKKPSRVIELAVKRMLPKTRLGRKLFTHLKVYDGAEHPHAAQKPEEYKLRFGHSKA
jgi:large subunit ribosomal protein L13